MRITKMMTLSNLFTNLNKLQSKINKNLMQISTNRRILVPSDDPGGTHRALNTRTILAKNEQYQRNITHATGWLEATESTLNQIHGLLSDVESLSNRGVTATYSADNRHGFARELTQHLETLLQFANETYEGKSLFSGNEILSAPFIASDTVTDESFVAQSNSGINLNNVHLKNGSVVVSDVSGSVVYEEGIDYTIDYENGSITVLSTGSMINGESYHIDYQTESFNRITINPNGINGKVTRHISENVSMDINVAGDQVFVNEINIFELLLDLRKKLERDDIDGIKNRMNDIQSAMELVTEYNGEIGAKLNRLSLTTNFLETENVNLKALKSSKEEVDMAEASYKYQALLAAYQVALASSSEITKLSLLNFIK